MLHTLVSKFSPILFRHHCGLSTSTEVCICLQGRIQGGVMGDRWPPFQAWISCISLLCLAQQPALPPSLQLMNLDLTQNIAKNLFVRWKSRVPLTSRAVCLVCGNNVGVVFTKVGVAKNLRIYFMTPPTWYPGSAPGLEWSTPIHHH